MAERRERDAAVARAEADLDDLFAPLARGVGASVRKHCRDGVTPLCRVAIMNDVDRLLDAAFGRWPGDDVGVLRLTKGLSREARATAFAIQVGRLRRALPVAIQRAVGLGDGR